jgi:hypothetical protein
MSGQEEQETPENCEIAKRTNDRVQDCFPGKIFILSRPRECSGSSVDNFHRWENRSGRLHGRTRHAESVYDNEDFVNPLQHDPQEDKREEVDVQDIRENPAKAITCKQRK